MIRFIDGNIRLSENRYDNFIQLNDEDFELSYLNPGIPSNKGASSNLFILQDPNGDTEDRVIKICKTPFHPNSRDRRISRFKREIRAFKLATQRRANGVISFYESGQITIGGTNFAYIILEKASGDLASYMEANHFNFTVNQKLSFCINIANHFRKLHDIGIYHRDIKHDNILVVEGELKIGDLGLVTFQDRDASIDSVNEKIGPVGWLSPEAINKMLTNNKNIGNVYDCVINAKSDIFQLGKLFWYIFQGNLPVGQITQADFRINDADIFNVIFQMLQHEKVKRPSMDELKGLLDPLKLKFLV